jgi:hypothetical protein
VETFAGLNERERTQLHALLAKLKRHLAARESEPTA